MSVTLSDRWRAWVADNLIDGVASAEIAAALVAQGVPQALAQAEVETIAGSPLLGAWSLRSRRVNQLEAVARLHRTHLGFAPEPERAPRYSWPDAERFYREFYAANRPVIFVDAMNEWPALSWTFEGLAERFGSAPVSVCTGRSAVDEPDRRFAELVTEMPFDGFIERVLAAGHTNDLYLIANNKLLKRDPFSALLDEVRPDPEVFDPAAMPRATSLWIGPAGTVTPLHHDVSNILFGQIRGRKRVTLIPPSETALLDDLRGFYCYRPGPPFDGVHSVVAELDPGEALLIPAGWYHHVEALEPSLNFSLLCFRRPNDLSWFHPGAPK